MSFGRWASTSMGRSAQRQNEIGPGVECPEAKEVSEELANLDLVKGTNTSQANTGITKKEYRYV